MTHSSMLHVRIDDEIKAQATDALGSMGLSISDAVRLFLKRVVNEQAFPIELKVPNQATREAMAESRQSMTAKRARFSDSDAMFNALNPQP